MSYTTILSVKHMQRPTMLAKYHNAFGWSPSIWNRLLQHRGITTSWLHDERPLDALCRDIDNLADWQAIPLVLTFDTGIIPQQEFEACADACAEFERRLPAPKGHVNHLPAFIELLRSKPKAQWIGVHGTSVTENPLDPWDEKLDEPGGGLTLTPESVYVLPQHRKYLEGNK